MSIHPDAQLSRPRRGVRALVTARPAAVRARCRRGVGADRTAVTSDRIYFFLKCTNFRHSKARFHVWLLSRI